MCNGKLFKYGKQTCVVNLRFCYFLKAETDKTSKQQVSGLPSANLLPDMPVVAGVRPVLQLRAGSSNPTFQEAGTRNRSLELTPATPIWDRSILSTGA